MLWNKLLGATAGETLAFVGGTALTSEATQTPSFSLTSLSGGLSSAPAAGDIVIACVGFNNTTNINIQCTTTGYVEVADLFSGSNQIGVYYKVLTAADTSVGFNLGFSTTSGFVCHVWRKINATPLDATTVVASSADPPAITTVTNNAVVLAFSRNSASFSTPSEATGTGMSNFFSSIGGGNFSRMVVASKVVYAPSTYDPPVLTNLANFGVSATMALRLA